MAFKLIDLFSGAGGMTLGFVDERFGGGFTPVLGLDNDPASVRTHKANFDKKYGSHSLCEDIEEWIAKGSEIPQADIVIGGPPCQGFSLLNKKREGDQRRALWEPYLEVVQRSGASMFVMENVAELYRSPELSDIKARAAAAEFGFETASCILNAADYGTPQIRRRTFVIGWKSEITKPVFPPPKTHIDPKSRTDSTSETELKDWQTVKDAISDLPDPIGTEIGTQEILNLHFGRNPTAMSLARYRAVPKGGNRFDLQENAPHLTPQCWIKKTSGGTDLFGRLWWDRPSVTIRTEFFKPEKGRYLHPEKHRPITHREAARLMGFPDDFVFVGSKTEIARQIGNAVPPDLAAALARVAFSALSEAKKAKKNNENAGVRAGGKTRKAA